MARPKKVPSSLTRSVLFRTDQVERLEAVALEAGLDLSDLVRLAVDRALDEPVFAARSRRLAALELSLRRLDAAPELVRELVVTGWEGREMSVPLETPLRPPVVKLVRRCVRLLRELGMSPPSAGPARRRTPAPTRPEFPDTWATPVPDDLLYLLASPAARAVAPRDAVEPRSRPVGVVVDPTVVPPAGAGEPVARPTEPHLAFFGDAFTNAEQRGWVVPHRGAADSHLPSRGVLCHIEWHLVERDGR